MPFNIQFDILQPSLYSPTFMLLPSNIFVFRPFVPTTISFRSPYGYISFFLSSLCILSSVSTFLVKTSLIFLTPNPPIHPTGFQTYYVSRERFKSAHHDGTIGTSQLINAIQSIFDTMRRAHSHLHDISDRFH